MHHNWDCFINKTMSKCCFVCSVGLQFHPDASWHKSQELLQHVKTFYTIYRDLDQLNWCMGVRIPCSRVKIIPPTALTSPHNPSPGKCQHQEQQEGQLWRASVPPSPSRGYCSPTNHRTWLQSRGARERRNDGWRSSMHPLGCNGELLWELLASLPYLLQYIGMSIAACRSCLHTPSGLSSICNHEMQELQSGKERKGKYKLAFRERNHSYITFQSTCVKSTKTSKSQKRYFPPYLRFCDKATISHPTSMSFVQNIVRCSDDTRPCPPF